MFGTHCPRCGVSLEGIVARMSYFNTDFCCLDCIKREQQHPDYKKARAAELAALRRGERDFPGIGKPADL